MMMAYDSGQSSGARLSPETIERVREALTQYVDAPEARDDALHAALHAMAQRTAERATATGSAVALEPMTAVERKVVHEFLKEDPEVETTSEGSEPNRYVVVLPRRIVD